MEMNLPAQSIDFGYLQGRNTMVVKTTQVDQHANNIRAALNLKRLEMEIHFPVMIKSKGRATERAYRFFVALDDQFSLYEVPENGASSLVVHVKNPPWYSRQLKEAMQMSHDPDSFKWSSEDTWSRQTDIVDEKELFQKINQSPVSLQKLHNSINIARWTTFRLTIKADAEQHDHSLRPFLTALADFNIRVTRDASFKVIRDSMHSAGIWDVLDGCSTKSLSEQLSLPYLGFDLRYQLEVCISKGWLNEYTLTSSFLRRLTDMPRQKAKQILVHVDTYEHRVYDPMSIFTDILYTKPVRAAPLPGNCAEIYHATITATGIIFHTPTIEITNRIVRKYQPYSDRFLRVRFEDDCYRGQTKLYPATNGKMSLIFERVRRALRKGIVIGDRHYEFLAWGNSQLREHGVYFFASSQNPRITADDIRRDMGTFDKEKVVAKRAARMGQCFSTTVPVPVLGRNSWRRDRIRDIKTDDEKYTFTDGVGKISRLAARLVKTNLKLGGKDPPSAFQFRLGGCKGVLTYDPTLTNVSVQIRDSQYKFDCESDELEIIRTSEYWKPFLNRQLVLVLSALGVPDSVFLRKQEQTIQDADAALQDNAAALEVLRDKVDPNQITLSIATMIEAGFAQKSEPFVASLLLLWRAWTLKYLKEKAKIPVQGAFVLGVADETRTLKGHFNDLQPGPDASPEAKEMALPEIFIQYSDAQGVPHVIEGICVIARNPSLHRGDVRVVKAVNVPQLDHLRDVLVMPTTGDRDLSSMCSGGDLDGDDYIVIWDPELIPQEWNVEPFHYTAPDPLVKDEISTDDIINFFYDYMQNDFLGRIATAHLAAADYLDDGLNSDQCLKLVELHSMAVDYPKTGIPAKMTRDLERNNWPHFMEKKKAGTYRSRKVLGRLYDAVERVNFQPHWQGSFDRRVLVHDPAEGLMGTVKELKKSYDESMRRIMAQHQISSEFEVWSTFVLNHSKAARDFKFHEEIGQHARTLKDQYHEAFRQEAGGEAFENLRPFAVAAYHVTHNEFQEALKKKRTLTKSEAESPGLEDDNTAVEFEMPLISFPWVLQDTLQKIAINTVLHDDSTAISNKDLLLSDQSDGADTDWDPERAIHRWNMNGEHWPDPYVPVALEAGVVQGEMADKPDQDPVKIAGKMMPPAAPLQSDQTSLKDMAPLRPPQDSRSSIGANHSPSDSGSMISSHMSSMASSCKRLSTSSGEQDFRPSDLSRSSATSSASSRLSGAGSHDHGQLPVLLSSTNLSQPQAHIVENVPFKDPGLMTEDEMRALTGDAGDDEDDFTF